MYTPLLLSSAPCPARQGGPVRHRSVSQVLGAIDAMHVPLSPPGRRPPGPELGAAREIDPHPDHAAPRESDERRRSSPQPIPPSGVADGTTRSRTAPPGRGRPPPPKRY